MRMTALRQFHKTRKIVFSRKRSRRVTCSTRRNHDLNDDRTVPSHGRQRFRDGLLQQLFSLFDAFATIEMTTACTHTESVIFIPVFIVVEINILSTITTATRQVDAVDVNARLGAGILGGKTCRSSLPSGSTTLSTLLSHHVKRHKRCDVTPGAVLYDRDRFKNWQRILVDILLSVAFNRFQRAEPRGHFEFEKVFPPRRRKGSFFDHLRQ